jgi:DNA-binding MarR family transcriptional regulator
MDIKQNQIDDLDKLWHVIMHTTLQDLPVTMDECLKELTTVDLIILTEIAQKPDIILKEIRAVTQLPNSTLTSVIDRLERRGLLKRVITERDRRSYGLMLTADGQRVYQAHFEFENHLFTAILQCLDSDAERALFLRLLGKIVHGLQPQCNR